MRDFNNKKTHASNGQELSDIFVGNDGVLSVYFKDSECEVMGFMTVIFTVCTTIQSK